MRWPAAFRWPTSMNTSSVLSAKSLGEVDGLHPLPAERRTLLGEGLLHIAGDRPQPRPFQFRQVMHIGDIGRRVIEGRAVGRGLQDRDEPRALGLRQLGHGELIVVPGRRGRGRQLGHPGGLQQIGRRPLLMAGLGGGRGPGQEPVVDVERQEAMQQAPEPAAGFEEGRRRPRSCLIDPIDDIHAAAEGDDDIGLQPALELIGQAVALLQGIGGEDTGVVDDIGMGGIELVQPRREQARERLIVRHLGAIDRRAAQEQQRHHGLPGTGSTRGGIYRAAIEILGRGQPIDVEIAAMIFRRGDERGAVDLPPLAGLAGNLAQEAGRDIGLAAIGGHAPGIARGGGDQRGDEIADDDVGGDVEAGRHGQDNDHAQISRIDPRFPPPLPSCRSQAAGRRRSHHKTPDQASGYRSRPRPMRQYAGRRGPSFMGPSRLVSPPGSAAPSSFAPTFESHAPGEIGR